MTNESELRIDDRGYKKDAPANQLCGCAKLEAYNWLQNIPSHPEDTELVEVRFKNTRKAYFRNQNQLRLNLGDIIAVEASPGHDIGIVSLTGELVVRQILKNNISPDSDELKKIYRKAKPVDIDKWKEAIALEHDTMIKSRTIADKLKLNMKIGDVEYQGDRTKAIFYYIADERVDFRELIKVLADEFKVRIEMKQIGARQEAGRIGGIGSCGRELCCSSWMSSFVSVTTSSARYQEISLNPQKLAGQCGKLKCCLNYEVHCYLDAQKDFPNKSAVLETEKGPAYHQKTDIFRQVMWYTYEQAEETATNLIPLSIERIQEIIRINKSGKKVADLVEVQKVQDIGFVGSNEQSKNLKKDGSGWNKKDRSRKKRRKKR